MINATRGEVALDLNGARYRLCLTLGALAEIETALGARDLSDLGAKLAQPGAKELIAVLTALLRGGGHEVNEREVASWPLTLNAITRSIAGAFAAAGFGESEAP